MRIVHGYRDDKILRDSFNELAGKVYGGLNFEGWYQNGFWKDNYDPYSAVIGNKVVSNISVNACDMNYDGRIVHLIQLGTVMTDPDHRGRGYSRALMERVLSDYEPHVDGIYLFANDSAVDFYPRFGFSERKEYQYSRPVELAADKTAVPVSMAGKSDWDRMVRILDESEQNSRMYMVSNSGLYMFYLSQFMRENTFYIPACDSYAVAESEDDTLILHAVIGKGELDSVISAFGRDVKKVILNFTPHNTEGYEKNELIEEDTHLFVKGRFFDETAEDAYMFQAITHA